MLKIRALNRESSSDDDAPAIRREAQEEIALDIYNNALRFQALNQISDAEALLRQLINENIPQLENEGGLPKTMSTIKYSCYVNLGNIAIQKNNSIEALDNYLHASQLDKNDVTLWYKIGTLALKLDRFRQAAYAFSMGLECSESHWPCLDQLITVLFALRDTITCLIYIGKALLLDSNFVKGLVLRKNIYDCNPATKDYYRLLNPDYILEPSMDIPIAEEHEEFYLKEVQILCDRVNEVERTLAPKPLPEILLPNSLDEFTWSALGKTLTDLHKYISDNNMTHFTYINLKNATNQNIMKSKEDANNMKMEEESKEKDESEIISNDKVIANQPEFDNNLIHRRLSQASENNVSLSDTVENIDTTLHTDDNEDMDQDIEEQEENTENKSDKNRSQSKNSNKRKRDLLLDLQIWGWHSKRKSTKRSKNEKDFTIEDAFNRIIPSYLLPNGLNDKYNSYEESLNIANVYNEKSEEKQIVNVLSPIHSPIPSQVSNYFVNDQEKDVRNFLNEKGNSYDVVSIIEDYVYSLSLKWNLNWPKELIDLYIEAYNMFREHCDHPPIYSTSIPFENFKNDSLATLLYGELVTFNDEFIKTEVPKSLHSASVCQLNFLSAWEKQWNSDYLMFFTRVHWLKAHLYWKRNQNLLAINELQLIKDTIQEGADKINHFKICLPNCQKSNIINIKIIDSLLKNLEMVDSLSRLEEMYNSQKYTEVADVLKNTFLTNNNLVNSGRMGRPAQIGILLHSLWFTDKTECFIWAEICLNEALEHFIKPKKNCFKWEMIIDKCVRILLEIVKLETVSIFDVLSKENRTRLVVSLCRICCRQINKENASSIPLGSVKPWILLHFALLREEHRQQSKKITNHINKEDIMEKNSGNVCSEDDDIPASIAILFSAHEFLGSKSWCLTDQGELLHFIIDTVLDRLDTPIFELLRDKIDIHLEQAFFCLYQHPSKKNKVSRHLADHNVNPIPLSWKCAQQAYEFFAPNYLPEFDSYKSISISSELEQLLQRIIALVPTEYNPQMLLPKIKDFVHGKSDKLPEPINFPSKIRSIYYLLGDYYFKQSEVKGSVNYFLQDLCINPLRLDSWACIALGIASQLDQKLTHCEGFENETEFLEKAESAKICFQQALNLANDHITLWIEYGSFEYMVHSYCSRILKYDSETFSMEKFDTIENKKENYIRSAEKSFQKALELHNLGQHDADERWLCHYMLAKIAEKSQKESTEYLTHYLTAATILQENNATYPEKINYNNPQHLSLEALEVHYRINASILKYLELHENKAISNTLGKIFKKCLFHSPFMKNSEIKKQVDSKEKQNVTENLFDIESVKSCLNDIIDQIEKNEEITMNKATNECTIETTGQESLCKKNDVIVLSDSDDDIAMNLELDSSKVQSETINVKSKNPQDIMDDLMKETMNKQETISLEHNYILKSADNKEEADKTENEELSKVHKHNLAQDENATNQNDSSSSSSSTCDSSSSDSESGDSSSSASNSSSENGDENLSDSEILLLVDRCIIGLELCIRRLPQNYKALYRLSHFYFHYTKRKDYAKSKQLFLSEYKCKNGDVVSGLFADRKSNNFFNGVWRIPSSEIDRPGSLAAHMGRCVSLLLQVLRSTNDYKTLLDVCLQLRRVPDPDKVYIRNAEREQLSEQALSLCIQTLRLQIKNVTSSNCPKLLGDIFKVYQRSQKSLVYKESLFAEMLIEVYKKYMGEKLPENVNVLDMAIKYCQQNKSVEKLKRQQIINVLPRNPILTTASPVLPTPTSITQNQSLKRPTLGRPRGRPPGPKSNTQARSPRGRSPMSTTNLFWPSSTFDTKTAYDYLQQYQDYLIRQYKQTLNLSQLTQLAQNQFLPKTTTQNLTNPMDIAQSLQQLSSNLNSIPTSHLQQSFNFLNPTLMQELIKQMNLPNYNVTTTTMSPLSTESLKSHTTLSQQSKILVTSTNTKSTSKINPSQSISKCLSNSIQITKTSTVQSSKSSNLIKPTYSSSAQQTKSFSNLIKSAITYTQSSNTNVNTTGSYKYLKPETLRIGPKDNKATYYHNLKEPKSAAIAASAIAKASTYQELEKATNLLMKDRPNISITPVAQAAAPMSSPKTPIITLANPTKLISSTITSGSSSQLKTSSTSPKTAINTSPTKTLQEKLADKQKQASNKNITTNFSISNVLESQFKSLGSKNIPSTSLSKETTITINQVPTPSSKSRNFESSTFSTFHSLEQDLVSSGIDLSAKSSKTPEEKIGRKQSPDSDDVIFIE